MRYIAKLIIVYVIMFLWFLWENSRKLPIITFIACAVTITDFIILKTKSRSASNFVLKNMSKKKDVFNPTIFSGVFFFIIGFFTKEDHLSYHGVSWKLFLGCFFLLLGSIRSMYDILTITQRYVYINEAGWIVALSISKIEKVLYSKNGLEIYAGGVVKKLDLIDRTGMEIENLITYLEKRFGEKLIAQKHQK